MGQSEKERLVKMKDLFNILWIGAAAVVAYGMAVALFMATLAGSLYVLYWAGYGAVKFLGF